MSKKEEEVADEEADVKLSNSAMKKAKQADGVITSLADMTLDSVVISRPRTKC